MQFRGGLVFKAHIIWYHSNLGLRVIKKMKKKKKRLQPPAEMRLCRVQGSGFRVQDLGLRVQGSGCRA